MKHVNGDMEDLFRRAAEKYPLRTDSADWDRLSAGLDRNPGPPSNADEDGKRRRRGIFWWWLLLPLAGALGFYGWRASVRPSTHLAKVPAAIAAPATAAPATGTTAAPATAPAGGAAATTGGAGTHGGGTTGGEQGGGTATGGTTDGGVQGPEANRAVTQAGGASSGATVRQGGATSAQAGGLSSGDVTSTERARVTGKGGKRMTGSRKTGSPGEKRGATALAAKAGPTAHEDGGNATTHEDGGNMISDANKDRFDAAKIGVGKALEGRSGVEGRSKIDSRRASTAGSFNLTVDVKAPAVPKDSSVKQTKKATAKSSHGHGYIGLTGAPDLSTVKMQATKGVGTTWGVVLGYSFNDHWAVESGVSLDRKKYYTAGEYFSKEGDPALLPYTIQSVNGTCNMWEIPINIRYNFNPGSKITWFATTGLSTYLMTKQQYTYSLETSGSYPWNQNWSTTVPSNYLFSIVNISGGFEKRIGSIGNLRIEPYLRIPLSGIGSGKLPIMSAGINIGITRRLW